MSTVKLAITIPTLPVVMATYNRIKIYRSVAGADGPWVEATSSTTRLTLVASIADYTYFDVGGDPDYHYRATYYHATTTAESDPIALGPAEMYPYYITVQDIRDEGLGTDVAGDTKVLDLIQTWQQFLERACRQWFVAREQQLDLDGTGSTLLQLPVPCIRLDALYLNGDFVNAVDPEYYVAYTGRGGSGRDDRRNPRIKLITTETDIFSGCGPLQTNLTKFDVGEGNQRIVGSFGYVESDGQTPGPIRYALRKLVCRYAQSLVGATDAPSGAVIEEETDKHRRKWSDAALNSKVWAVTGDPEVDQIIASYRGPLVIRAPRTVFRRFSGKQIYS